VRVALALLVLLALPARAEDEARADALAELALVAAKNGESEKFSETLDRIRFECWSEKAVAKTGAVYFEPYARWVLPGDAKKLEAGGELVDGEWLEKDAVAALDKKHSATSDPWVLSDEVHELRTTVPYRKARALLLRVGAYRRFFLSRVKGEWDLRAPAGKLPVIVTETQAQLRAQMKDRAKDVERLNAVAYYLQSPRSLDPCIATFEPTDASGAKAKVGIEDVIVALQHEVTHQIAYEYSKHDFDRTRAGRHQAWCVEGLATFFMSYSLEKSGWRLRLSRRAEVGWCVANKAKLPSLEGFIALTKEKFLKPEQYALSAGLAYFLLEGEGGKYRARFMKLLEVVHRVKDTDRTWKECFAKVDLKQLQRELVSFLERVELED
jgi:hypothetical protein